MPPPITPKSDSTLAALLRWGGSADDALRETVQDGVVSQDEREALRKAIAADRFEPVQALALRTFLEAADPKVALRFEMARLDDDGFTAADARALQQEILANGGGAAARQTLTALLSARDVPLAARLVLASATRGTVQPLVDGATPLHLGPAGHLLARSSPPEPQHTKDLLDGLVRGASLVDTQGVAFLKNLTAQDRALLIARLNEAFHIGASAEPASTLNESQRLLLRSAVATMMLALLEVTPRDDETGSAALLKSLTDIVKAEGNAALKDAMIWNGYRIRDALPEAAATAFSALHEAQATSKPPYDKWFQGENRTINVVWTTGTEGEFVRGVPHMLKAKGFAAVGEDDPPKVLEKTFDVDGQKTTVRITMQANWGDKIFNAMDKDDVQMVMFDGHSDYGRCIPASLAGAPSSTGDGKLVFLGLCGGKQNLGRVSSAFPQAQVVTTFNSSWFSTQNLDDKKTMTSSDNVNAFLAFMEGAARRETWDEIRGRIRENMAFPYERGHVLDANANYITPTHHEVRRRLLDADGDGRADFNDRFHSPSAAETPVDTTAPELAAKPTDDVGTVNGRRFMRAVLANNRYAYYNGAMKPVWKHGNIVAGGFFDGTAKDGPVRFSDSTIKERLGHQAWARDPKKIIQQPLTEVSLERGLAHLSEEAMRAVVAYELTQHLAERLALVDPASRKLMGMMMVAFSLGHDENRSAARDRAVWNEFLKAYNLPVITMRDVESVLNWDADSEDAPAGDMAKVRALRKKIEALDDGEAILDALKQDDVGRWRPGDKPEPGQS